MLVVVRVRIFVGVESFGVLHIALSADRTRKRCIKGNCGVEGKPGLTVLGIGRSTMKENELSAGELIRLLLGWTRR